MKSKTSYKSRRAAFSRRRFIGGGSAVMIGLPLLEAFVPGRSQAQAGGAQRLITLMAGNGMPMGDFVPSDTGAGFELPPTLEGFAPVREKIAVFSGLGIDEGEASPGDHGAGIPVAFTCEVPEPTHPPTNNQNYEDEGNPFHLGESIDQIVASTFAEATRIRSLQLGLTDGNSLGDGGYGPIYLKNISWASATQPLSPTINPSVVFDQIFAGIDPQATAEESARRLRRRRSVLDYAAAERELLVPALGAADKARLDQYFTSLREIEQRLQPVDPGGPSCGLIPKPGEDLSYAERMTAMLDLMVVALQCDVTRAISLHMGGYRNDDHYGFLGASDDHHSLSHATSGSGVDEYETVCRWLMDQMAALLIKLDAVDEVDGSLLDNCLAVFNSDCGNGNSHDHEALPVLVGGTAGGRFPTGQHYAFPKNTPCASLYVSMLNSMGIEIETFGSKDSGALGIL